MLHEELSRKVIGCFFTVHKKLGYGFLESVYENALMKELELNDIKAESQVGINVKYKGFKVGKFFADILVEDKIILELKSTSIAKQHDYQLLNYLKATEIEVGYVLSFGKEGEFLRRVFSNDRK